MSRLLVALLIGCAAAAAQAQSWPSKTVRMIVPYPPGGSTDVTARALADKISAALGQPVIVENRVGAGGNIGIEAAARSDPDGYTVLIAPDFDELTAWAAQQGIAEMPPEQLIQEKEVDKLFDAEVKRTLEGFAVYERPRRIALLPRLLSEEAGELTPSLKTKNRVVLANWPDKTAYLFDEKRPGAGD